MNATETEKLLRKLKDQKVRWHDKVTDLTFEATPSDVLIAEYDINRLIIENDIAFVEDWVGLLNVDCDWKPYMLDSGWNIECMVTAGEAWLYFTHTYEEDANGSNGRFVITPSRFPCDGITDDCGTGC